jgi:AAA domain
MPPKRRPRGRFLAGYKEDESYLVKPDTTLGRPGLLQAQAPDGRRTLIKFWPRLTTSDQTDLEDIWRSEIRQLHRLAAIPRADDLFVPMLASGEDDEGFYLVLNSGEGSPLELFRTAANTPQVIAQPRLPRNRRLIWANALRVAQALDLLHSQGVIHRNLDPWAVVTSFGDDPDFRLTGFEWSMRIAALDGGKSFGLLPAAKDSEASFGHDWRNLGPVVAELIGAPAERVADLRLLPTDIAEHLSAREGRVLRMMLGVEHSERLDGELICNRIGEVVAGIEAQAAGKELKLALALRLGTGTNLARVIRRASGNEIEMTDVQGQLQFVRDDLSQEPFLARIKDGDKPNRRIALLGHFLTYTLSPYRQPGSSAAADWEFAIGETAEFGRPPPAALDGYEMLAPGTLDLAIIPDAYKRFPRRRSRVARWDERIRAIEPKQSRKTELDRKHQAFALLTVLEMAFAAADIFPVEVLPAAASKSGDLHTLQIASHHDPARAALTKGLQLESPALRLARMLEADDLRGDDGRVLSESGSLGDRNETEWRFVDKIEQESGGVLRFEGPVQSRVRGPAFLAPAGMRGQIAQFRRRVKALRALREHTELLGMLVDPRERIDDSHDPVSKDKRFKELDPSKQLALDEILSTIPLFLLQGPPGVGKTFLVGDLVRRRFNDEATTRILLSAQSNAAIDHLMKEVQSVFLGSSQPVMVRARPADDDPADTDLEIDIQADRLLQDLARSDLEHVPPQLNQGDSRGAEDGRGYRH